MKYSVVPYVGTWIEILAVNFTISRKRGRSLRGNVDRNLPKVKLTFDVFVVPYVGTWIEIFVRTWIEMNGGCRSLRGNVDRNSLQRLLLLQALSSFPTWERG